MTTVHHDKAIADSQPDAAREMAKHGITCVPVDYFHFGQYRYTHLEDAIAEAERHLVRG